MTVDLTLADDAMHRLCADVTPKTDAEPVFGRAVMMAGVAVAAENPIALVVVPAGVASVMSRLVAMKHVAVVAVQAVFDDDTSLD